MSSLTTRKSPTWGAGATFHGVEKPRRPPVRLAACRLTRRFQLRFPLLVGLRICYTLRLSGSRGKIVSLPAPPKSLGPYTSYNRGMQMTNKVVIITGASSGIGAAAARAFAAAGARVVLAARDEPMLREVAATLPARSLVVPTDVAVPEQVAALVQRAVAEFGAIDILINNAGVGLAAPVAVLEEAELHRAMQVNLFGPLALTQAALPFLRRSHGQVMFVSSVVGLRALPYLGGYAATKAALDRLSESLRVELRGSGVAVTLVRPGTTSTGFAANRLGGGHERRRMNSHAATPEQVAAVLVKASIRRPRVAYITRGDRLNIAFSLLAPGLADRLLGWAFEWED